MKKVQKAKKLFLKWAHSLESIIAIVVLIAVLLGTIDIARIIWRTYIIDFANPVQYEQINDILGQALLLVIGVELVIMLSLHIPGALLEVLLYAIARKLLLLPKTSSMIDLVLGVVAIAGLFAIKKYLTSDDSINMNLCSTKEAEEAITRELTIEEIKK
jgi:hypothetical protein